MKTTVCVVLGATLFGLWDEEVFQDFTTRDPMCSALRLYGEVAAAERDSTGLRFTLPLTGSPKTEVGLEPSCPLSGDFEVTLKYELLSASEPRAGFGNGVRIWCKIGSVRSQAVTVAHVIRPQSGNQWMAIVAPEGPGGPQEFYPQSLGADQRRGALRLVRRGTQLRFLAASDDQSQFAELHRCNVLPDEVTSLRVTLSRGNPPTRISVSLKSLRLRADRMPGRESDPRAFWYCVAAWLVALPVGLVAGYVEYNRQRVRRSPAR